MATLTKEQLFKSFDAPDETVELSRSKLDFVSVGGRKLMRITLYPGWRWSEDVKPSVGGELCQETHIGYQLSGMLRVTYPDGAEIDGEAGTLAVIQPNHDSYVVGDEPVQVISWEMGIWGRD